MTCTRLLLLLLVALTATGCRLSMPFYAFKSLSVPEQEWPERSLVVGRIVFENAMTTADAEAVLFEKIDRTEGNRTVWATENIPFRVFRPRLVKDGYFSMSVAPGVYELDQIHSSFLWSNQVYKFEPADRRASRLYITKPGIYDLGCFVVRIRALRYVIERAEPPNNYAEIIRSALAGTSWEKYLPQPVNEMALLDAHVRAGQ